jgi:S-formylglutathione hydrolase FrmB
VSFCDFQFYSAALQKQTAAYVILPEAGTGPFPVLYLLHGLSDNHTIWLRRTSIERYVANLPLIVVMPDGGRGFYADAEQGFAYGKAIGTELIERIDRTFPTKAERGGRCIAGLSMGGYGALRLGLSHPDLYCAAVSHSGALNFGHQVIYGEHVRPMAPEFARILGENPTGGPNDLYALAEKSDRGALPTLRIDCGTEDHLIEANRTFHTHLETLGIAHEYEEHPGAHDWAYWDLHIQDTLKFMRTALEI